MWEIEEIVDEWQSSTKATKMYKVRWAGYHASWERWRVDGAVGSPLETWEPARNVSQEDLAAWASRRQ